MKLAEIFRKRVDRQIEGVIKADDEANLKNEVEEYVLTNEVVKRLEHFFQAYNDYRGANGVWISGFFGSGKSHLLKMLAYLLDSSSPDARFIAESFFEKTADEAMLRAEIEKALRIPSRSILFNIDQKADVISKEDFDALLSVFVKVFDEMQGYYGKQGHIAKFERELDNRGLYDAFKAEYESIAGQSWENGREESLLESHNIAEAYRLIANVPASAAESIIDKYWREYRVSIEDFAELVNDYIKRQDANFRLNFFVDEVGQYIANNIKLMTNLQTIAESLATKSRGRAWIIVTAQEDMDDVVGTMGKQQGNDFSKIQDRFRNRMKLTSQYVSEVIQRRLLSKNADGSRQLAHLYKVQANNFKTLFDFVDGSHSYRNFRDEAHFIDSYPFIPYQFDLFQSAIQALSLHNAFEGKHSSVGERSMLGVFQQVAIHIGNYDIKHLATFALMFEGIRYSLKTQIQQSILRAEKQLDNELSLGILKALFLVKYVREFKATEHNITILMTEGFDQDISQLRKDVQEALNLLEQQTYIQRNGEIYEYLTDEEKDIEQEIKNTDVETSKLTEELGKIIFDGIIAESKIRVEGMAHDYPFTRKLDDELFRSKAYELAINVISPFHEHIGNQNILVSRRMGEAELLIILPPDDRLVTDLRLYAQTGKYFQQNYSSAQTDQARAILSNKQQQNNQRLEAVRERLRDLMTKAAYFVNNSQLELTSTDPKSLVIRGFQQLIRMSYTNLKMMGDKVYKEADISQYLTISDDIFGAIEMSEAEREIHNVLLMQYSQGKRVNLNQLLEQFERKPYGWYRAAILANLAKLSARAKLILRLDSNDLEGLDLEENLLNSNKYPHIVIIPAQDFSPAQIRMLRDFYGEFFDEQPKSDDAKKLSRLTRDALENAINFLENRLREQQEYPFVAALEPVVSRLKAVAGKSMEWYLTEFRNDAEELLEMKDNILNPLLSFKNGPQIAIYDEAREFLKTQRANFQTVGYDEALEIQNILRDPQCYLGTKMRHVRELLDGLNSRISSNLQEAKNDTFARLEGLRQRLLADESFGRLNAVRQKDLLAAFDEAGNELERYSEIAVIQNYGWQFENQTWAKLLQRLAEYSAPAPEARPHEEKVVHQPQHVRKGDLQIPFGKVLLENESDVEAYLERLRAAYLKEIRGGKIIQL